MKKEEAIINRLQSQDALAFINAFLTTFPSADLFLVGGAVRDALMGRDMQERDWDFVIRGLESAKIEEWFNTIGELNLVGQHFGVYKFLPQGFTLNQIDFIDIALPRTEAVQEGSLGGYKDFHIQSDSSLPIEDDLARRDFTINAMAINLRTKELVDPFNGAADLKKRIVRAVGAPEERFTEDLSRILRAIRFAAELQFQLEPETRSALKELLPRVQTRTEQGGETDWVVPRETIGTELAKALHRAPTHAIKLLQELDAFSILMPEVDILIHRNERELDPLLRKSPTNITTTISVLLRNLEQATLRQTLHENGLDRMARSSAYRIDPDQIAWIVQGLQTPYTPESVSTMPASKFERRFMNGKGERFVKALEQLDKQPLAQAAIKRRNDI